MNDTKKTTDQILRRQIAHTRELLKKLDVVVSLAHSQVQQRGEIMENLARQQVLAEIKRWLKRLHVADIAYLISNTEPDKRMLLWHEIGASRAGDTLLELDEAIRRQLISQTGEAELLSALQHLDADDLAFLADDIPQPILEQALKNLSDS